jgi:hypothetical protein
MAKIVGEMVGGVTRPGATAFSSAAENIYDQALIASDATEPQRPYTRPHCGGLLAHRCVLIVWEQPSFAEGLLRLASKPVLLVAIAG